MQKPESFPMKREKKIYFSHKTRVSVEEANEMLRYAIRVLRGQNIVSRLEGRIQIALIMRDRLLEADFWWQAGILEAWIHRAQGGEFPG